ncbi:hypothetical protein DH2020_020509 [Rehmannia glutinosa]|uniref:UBX domain-containing protein n=1 Tax=Rehmannia glutinosa TaxID=99300 RepID=A0ABR0WL08_REHGL
MEGILSAADQQIMVSTFLEIAVGQSADTARQFLQDSALGKDLVPKDVRQDDGDDVRAPLPVKRDVLYDNPMLYGGVARMGDSSYATHSVVPFRNFEEEMKYPGVWEAEKGSSSSVVDKTQDNLASLYRPPFALILSVSAFNECKKLCFIAFYLFLSFFTAKDNARMQNKWLLVNMQSTKEFSSHMLNRDTWANEAVAQTIKTNFIFWQVYDDTEEGRKVCTYYKLDSIPVILVIDPITGQKMHSWRGMVQPETLLEDLLPFMDSSPADHVSQSHKRPRESSQAPIPHLQCMPGFSLPLIEVNLYKDEVFDTLHNRALAASMENSKDIDGDHLKEVSDANAEEKVQKPAYLPLPEEPKGDRSLLCRVGVRLPDGRRVQRNFLRTDPVQLLWSFCCSELKEDGTRPFRLTQAIPGATKSLDFNVNSTFEESGLANSMVSVYWE